LLMEILNSEWLIRMLKKSSNNPQDRLLNLFNVLDDWLDAPKIEASNNSAQTKHTHLLQDFLALEAAKASAEMPEMLASQLYFMALAAAQEKLFGNNPDSLTHAKHAAEALIKAQTSRHFHFPRKIIYASAASFAFVSFVAGAMVFANLQQPKEMANYVAKQETINPVSNDISNKNQNKKLYATAASPTQTAELFARIEQMRKGNCQLIEAIQLPDAYKKIYFENIVMGQISTNRDDQRIVNELLQMVRCNYTPMLMANSK